MQPDDVRKSFPEEKILLSDSHFPVNDRKLCYHQIKMLPAAFFPKRLFGERSPEVPLPNVRLLLVYV